MWLFDSFPTLNNFAFTDAIDLKTGSLIIASLGIVYPMFFIWALFLRTNIYLLIAWVLVILYSAFSILLLIGVIRESKDLYEIYIWYAFVFAILMSILSLFFCIFFCQWYRTDGVVASLLQILLCLLIIYFIFVVNSHRIKLGGKSNA